MYERRRVRIKWVSDGGSGYGFQREHDTPERGGCFYVSSPRNVERDAHSFSMRTNDGCHRLCDCLAAVAGRRDDI